MEGLFSTNDYNTPKTITGKEEIAVLIIRLLLLEPGTDPLHPEMGVGILSRYKHCLEDDISELQLEIQKQITVYMPQYQTVSVTAQLISSELYLTVNIDDTLYNFTTGSSTGSSASTSSDVISLSNL